MRVDTVNDSMSPFILCIDQGTTGSTAVLLSSSGEVLAKANREFPQHYPQPGWVEHDLDEIWQSVLDSIADVFAKSGASPKDCAGIGITNQRETTIVWERKGGAPIHRAIVWQDRRTSSRTEELRASGYEALVRERTGLVLDPYFSGTKIDWILNHVDGARARAQRGELCFGTIDSWLVWRLSDQAVHVTDATNASRTMLFDIRRGAWAEDLAALLRVPMAMLPDVKSCSERYAVTQRVPGLPDGIPIAGIAGDQQAALFGQTCFSPGEAKCTYGTGAFLLMNTGETAVASEHGLLTTVALRLGDRTTYALEGSAFIAGAAVQWLREGLGLIKDASEIDALASSVASAGDVVFVPALAGLGAPHWDPHARGLLWGLTRDTTRAHVARAVLEGIAFEVADLALAMVEDSRRSIGRLRVDGGVSQSDLVMSLQADLLDVEVDRPSNIETTALGAGYLAGLAVGVFTDLDDVVRAHRIERSWKPTMASEERTARLLRWREAVARAKSTEASR